MSSRERTPDHQSTDTATAVPESPAAENNTNSPSFVEKVGQREHVSAPDPFAIARDNLAGVRLFESRQDRQMAIQFGEGRPEDKPSRAVIGRMKEAGYRWNPSDRIWAFPVGPASSMRTRREAQRLYQEVCKMIRLERGIVAGPETSR